MKNLLFLLCILFAGCLPEDILYDTTASDGIDYPDGGIQFYDPVILYDDNGVQIPDFIPALQSFVNEGCQTAWDNLSGIRTPDGDTFNFKIDNAAPALASAQILNTSVMYTR